MNLKRVLTTLIGLPIVIMVLILGNEYIIGGIVLVASIICMYEYFNVIKKVCKPVQWIGYLSNVLIVIAAFFQIEIIKTLVIFSIPVFMLLLFLQVIITNMKTTFKDVAYTLLSIVYIPFFLMFVELIRKMENGKILIGFIFAIAWGTDILAYLIGKHFGKHYFSKVSPKKTIEGSVAGIIGAIVFTLVYTIIVNKFCNVEYSYIKLTIISALLSVISQVGDFAASIIKRFADTKDYGNLIPGHGGMLDRIDSLLFIAPFAYMIFYYLF